MSRQSQRRGYVVLEHAGCLGECEIEEFRDFRDAVSFVDRWYGADEVDDLHVQIAKRLLDGRLTYEY